MRCQTDNKQTPLLSFIKLFMLWTLFFTGVTLWAGIANTKHNLSVSKTAGTVKATSETEICVFCHTPHETQPVGKPLWNRNMPTSIYTMYDSDYLRRLSYPDVALDLGQANNTPGALSRQCLSCHDGTVAVGAVSKLRSGTYNTTIAMLGTTGDKIPASTPDGTIPLIGTDLSVHHPVAIEFNPNISVNFGVGSRPIELVNDPTLASPVRLFDYGGTKYIECSSCHDPHKENGKFLHVDTEPTHGENVVKTCTSCHEKIGWTGSVHQTQTAAYSDANVLTKYGTNQVGKLGCLNCHMPHNALGKPYINRQVQANTCFQGAADTVGGANCHGAGGAKDIHTPLSKLNAHPVLADTAVPKHTNFDTLYGTGVIDPSGAKGVEWIDNKHAMCMDCHNPHKAKAGTHVTDGSWYGVPSSTNNNVSNVLNGVNGVEPSWPLAWTQPTTFTTLESSTKEYQICLKCHSYWGVGTTLTGVTAYPSVSDPASVMMTDVAWEMNKNNKSGHPVVLPNSTSGRPGSYLPQALDSTQLRSPWQTGAGTNTMYCSDCHGNDTEGLGDPKGPHGSDMKFMLKGVSKYWPKKPSGSLYTQNDIPATGGVIADLFCTNCHDVSVPHRTEWNSTMAGRGYSCVTCHVAIPHGSPVSRLIGYSNFPSPYNYNGNSLKVTAFKKNALSSISIGDVKGTACMCHNMGFGSGYDPNPYP